MLEEFHEDQSWNNLNTIGAGINWAIGCEAPDMSASEDAYLRQGFRGNMRALWGEITRARDEKLSCPYSQVPRLRNVVGMITLVRGSYPTFFVVLQKNQ